MSSETLFYGPKILTEETRAAMKISPLPAPKDKMACYKRSAQIHKLVRARSYEYISEKLDLLDFTNKLEADLKDLCKYDKENPLRSGQAFPTGVSVGHVAAHDTPNSSSNKSLIADLTKDVISIDFGVHTYGYLIDCAFSLTYNPVYNSLVDSTKAATYAGIKAAGAGVRLCEIGEIIKEVMESYTMELPVDYLTQKENRGNKRLIEDKRLVNVKAVENLNGHNVGQYVVHSGKTVPSYNNKDNTKMNEGEFFAIETFGSTGKGLVEDFGGYSECSHYMLSNKNLLAPFDFLNKPKNNKIKHIAKIAKGRGAFRSTKTRKLAEKIVQYHGSLAFCKKWLSDILDEGSRGWAIGLKTLESEGFVEGYPPLADIKRSQVSQLEHTIYIDSNGKVVNLSQGTDF